MSDVDVDDVIKLLVTRTRVQTNSEPAGRRGNSLSRAGHSRIYQATATRPYEQTSLVIGYITDTRVRVTAMLLQQSR